MSASSAVLSYSCARALSVTANFKSPAPSASWRHLNALSRSLSPLVRTFRALRCISSTPDPKKSRPKAAFPSMDVIVRCFQCHLIVRQQKLFHTHRRKVKPPPGELGGAFYSNRAQKFFEVSGRLVRCLTDDGQLLAVSAGEDDQSDETRSSRKKSDRASAKKCAELESMKTASQSVAWSCRRVSIRTKSGESDDAVVRSGQNPQKVP